MTQMPVLPAPQVPKPLRWRGGRVVGALLLREMSTTYGRTPGGYIWAILQPVAMIALLTVVFSFILRAPSLGTSFVLFYATGFLPLRTFQEVSNSVGAAVQFNLAMMAYPRVTFVDVLTARALLSVMTQIMVTAIVLTAVLIIEDARSILDFRPILITYAAVIFLAVGIGTLNSYLTFSFHLWRSLWSILTRPLFLISGVFFIYEDLPRTAQDILWFNPVLHLTGLMRTGVYSTYTPEYISVTYVAVCAGLPLVFGLLLLFSFCKDAIYK
ncbi:MAG: ABC transporter permease [Pseudomonadota bacterium]